MTSTDLAKSSLLAAALNSFVAIVLRLLTFISNAFILRYVSRSEFISFSIQRKLLFHYNNAQHNFISVQMINYCFQVSI
jgi:hypothetical protein